MTGLVKIIFAAASLLAGITYIAHADTSTAATIAVAAVAPVGVLLDTKPTRIRDIPQDSKRRALRRRFARLDPKFVEARIAQRVKLELFDDVHVIASRIAAQKNKDGFTWFGSVEGEFGDVVLTSVLGHLRGTVYVGEREYLLQQGANGNIQIVELGPIVYDENDIHLPMSFDDVQTRKLPTVNAEVWTPTELFDLNRLNRVLDDYDIHRIPLRKGRPPLDHGFSLLVDDGSVIDVLPIFTNAAVAFAGTVSELELIIQHAFDRTNMALNESGVTTWLNMLPLRFAVHAENPDWQEEIASLIDPTDGVLDEVHQWRDEKAADLMVVFGGPDAYDDIHGAAHSRKQPVDNAVAAEKAFAIFNIDSVALGSNIFPHELGHLLGVAHDWYVKDSNSAGFDPAEWLPDAHGFTTPAVMDYSDGQEKRYKTIMAYANECSATGFDDEHCPWLPRFSNPNHFKLLSQPNNTPQPSFSFLALGRALPAPNAANSVRALNTQIIAISNHRLSACRLFPSAPGCP